MGALVGSLYAVGKLEEYERWILGFDKLDILRMIDFTLSDEGFIKGERVFEQMRKLDMIPDICIEDLPIPFTAVAVDILKNKERVFSSGSILHAIRASIAIPLVFTPVHEGGGILVDGGVLSPLPLDYVKRVPGDILVAVDLNAPIPYTPISLTREHNPTSERFRNLLRKWDEMFGHRNPSRTEEKIGSFDLIMRSVQLLQHRLTTYALVRTPPDVLIQISKDCATVFEFYRAKELIEYGRAVCREALDRFEATC